MKWQIAFLLTLIATLAVPPTNAALDTWKTTVGNVGGLINGGSIDVYLQHPDADFGRVGDSFHSSAFMAAPTITNPGITWSINHAHGCTTANPTTRTTTTAIATVSSFDFDITTTGTTCSVSIRLLVTAGVLATTIYDQQLTLALASSDVQCSTAVIALDAKACDGTRTVTDDGNGWAITGIPDTQQELQAIADAIVLLQSIGVNVTGSMIVDLLDDSTNDGAVTVDVADDSTDDGYLSMPPVDINSTIQNATFNTTFPSTFDVNARFPGGSDNPGFDFWAGVVFWLLVLGFFLYQAWWFAAGFAIPGLLDTMFPTQIPDDMSLYLTLCLLGVVLEVAAHKFSFGHWRTRNSRPNGG